jgi:hypothetical protein
MPPRAPPAPGPRPPPRAAHATAATAGAGRSGGAGDAGDPGPRSLALRPWRWLLLIALPAACSAPPPPRPVYTNHWAVQVLGGPAAADRVAAAHGYLNLGQVSAAGPARVANFAGGRRAEPRARGRLCPLSARPAHSECGAWDAREDQVARVGVRGKLALGHLSGCAGVWILRGTSRSAHRCCP